MECLGVSSGLDLQALSALLSTQQQQQEEEDDFKNPAACSHLGPRTYWAPTQKDKEVSTTAYTKTNSKDIWSEEEVAEGSQYDNLTDPRPQPEYEIVLKQNVGTQDLFLGLSGKDPSSMCCEALLVKIKLPDTKATDVFLDIKEKFLDLRTPKYKLGLHLPHPIQSQEGRAQFFSDRKELEVTLLMKRPMDFVNMQ